MIITKETDYALRILRALKDGKRHSAVEMSKSEMIPSHFVYKILQKLSSGSLVKVNRGATGGCELSCDLGVTSLYDLMTVMGDKSVLCACMEPGYVCHWQDDHGVCQIHCQLAILAQKQKEIFSEVSLLLLMTGEKTLDTKSEL